MNNLDNFEVVLCPTYQQAASLPQPEYSVEAEYGKEMIEGKYVTLAHHDNRSDNPAPCNTEIKSYEDIGGTILVSHLDIDAVGGIMAITGDKPNDPEFWEGAEHIDVNGVHHIHELPQDVQDKLNAIYAWNSEQHHERITEPTNVTDRVRENYEIFEKVLDRTHPEHDAVIEKGREWEKNCSMLVEERCVLENEFVRAFKTSDVFCGAGYHSEKQDKDIPATVTYNEKFHSISVAFFDGGIEKGGELSAKEIVQELWGPEAGGRDGIAGSPRGMEMSEKDFEKCLDLVMDKLIEKQYEHEIEERQLSQDRDIMR